jgi:hypothetical protein
MEANVRIFVVLCGLLFGCSAEQGFAEGKAAASVAGGDGRIEIFPAGTIVFEAMGIGGVENAAFRIDSVGEAALQIKSIEIVDSGENGGASVFTNLRAHDEDNIPPFNIDAGEGAEFLVTASMTEPGEALGSIEIWCNDPTVEDPSPGRIRLAMQATAIDYAAGDSDADADGDDTGSGTSTGSDDTGSGTSTGSDDTGSTGPSDEDTDSDESDESNADESDTAAEDT